MVMGRAIFLIGFTGIGWAIIRGNVSVKCQQILQAAIKAGYLGDEQALAAFVDISSLTKTISTLHQAFPEHFTHTFAAKANTMSSALALV